MEIRALQCWHHINIHNIWRRHQLQLPIFGEGTNCGFPCVKCKVWSVILRGLVLLDADAGRQFLQGKGDRILWTLNIWRTLVEIMSVTGTRDRGSNWCAGTGPASARQPPARPDNILFFIHWSHLILTFSNNSTRNCRDCCWKYVYENTNLKSSKSSSFKCNSFFNGV